MKAVGPFGSLLSRFQAQLAEGEASDRSFGLVLGIILIIIGLIPLLHRRPLRLWSIVLGAVLMLAGSAYPAVLRWPKRAWLFLGFLMGLVINPIVLGILFFVVVTPVGILLRVFGRDPLLRRRPPSSETYWRIRSEPASDMSEQF